MNANPITIIHALVVACFLAPLGRVHAAVRYTAPFGPSGTWNVYEYVDTPTTFWLAHQASTQAVHLGVSGHLVTIRSKEEDLAVGRMAGGDIWMGLTDQGQLGGTETGTNPNIAKWGGWRGDVNEIPLNVRASVQSNGWVWLTGESYNYQAWDGGEPNNYGAGEGGVRRRGSGFWNDDGIGAFGQPASTASYLIEYETHSPFPDPGAFQLESLFPATRLPGIEGGPGFASVEVYRNDRPFDDVEPVIGSLAIGEFVNPFLGTAPVINYHDPQSGGGGLFPSGRLIFPGNTAADDNNFQVLIKGAIEVPAGRGGTWTFNVHADDGFAFRINGAGFTSAHGNGYIDFADRSTLTYPEPTGDANTRGVINLLPGVYPFQFVMFELGGGAFCELSAAPGVHPTDASTTQWALVNSPNSPLKFVPLPTKPEITQQPVGSQVAEGDNVTLTVSASGATPLSYQWRLDAENIPGATDASLIVENMQYEKAGDYTVVVSNSSGSVTSNPARLSLVLPASPPSLTITVDGQTCEINTESHSPGFYRLMESTDLVNWTNPGRAGFVGGNKIWLRKVPTEGGRFFRLEKVEVPAKETVFVQFPAPSYFGHLGTVELVDSNGAVVKRIESDENGRISFVDSAVNLRQLRMRYSYFGGLVYSTAESFDLNEITTPDHAHNVPIISSPEFGFCLSCRDCSKGSSPAILNQSATPMLSGNVRAADGALLHYLPGPSQTGPFGNPIGLNHWFHTGGTSDGSFGRNVSADFDLRIQRISPTVIVLLPGFNQRIYLESHDGGTTFLNNAIPGLVVTYDEGTLQFRVNLIDGLEFAIAEGPIGVPGHVVSTKDHNGIVTTYERDSCGQATVIRVEGTGTQYSFSYTVNPHVKSVTDQLGRTWEFTYDSSNRLVEARSPATEFADIAPGVLLTDTTLSLEAKPRRTTFAYTDPNFPNYLTSITDERGAVTRAWTYDAQGRVSTQTINGHTMQYIYEPTASPTPLPKLDAGNILTRVIDPEGNMVDTEMMGPGHPGQYGIRRRVTWTESGKGNAPLRSGEPRYYEQRWRQDCNCLTPLVVTQPFSDQEGQFLSFDAHGIPEHWPRTIYTYNTNRQVEVELFTSDQGTIRTEMTYQPNGYGVSNQFAKMLTRTEARAFDGNPIHAGLNFTHTYEYDAQGNMTKHTSPTVTRGVTNPQPVVESWTHNTNGQVLTHADPNGNLTINTYHSGPATGGDINTKGNYFGYLASVTRGASSSTDPAVNLTTAYLVNALGQVTRMIDPMGHTFDTDYNELGEDIRTIEPPVTTPNGPIRYETRKVYDGAGNVVMIRRSNVDYLGHLQPNAFIDKSMSYDAGNNLLAERQEVDANDGNDLLTSYAYDRNDQLIAVQKPEGNRMFIVHDERRMAFKQFTGVDPGALILAGYPADKRAVTLSGAPFIAMARSDYDSKGNLIFAHDGRGNPISRRFDFRNRQVWQADQNGNGWLRSYDAAGNVLTTEYGPTGPNGTLTSVLARSYARFDELGRQYQMVQDINPATSEASVIDPAAAENSSFITRFDAGSRTIASLDANGNPTIVAYDAANRRTTVTDALGNTVTTLYDPDSNAIEIQETELPGPGSSGPPQTYFTTNVYDALNRRIETHVLGLNRTIDHRATTAYDSRGNAVLRLDAEGKAGLNTYDDQNRLVMMQRFNMNPTSMGAQELQRSEFRYDGNNRKTNDIAYSDVSQLAASAQITRYEWDNADRQTLSVYPDSEDADDVVRTAYDANGNPVWVRDQRGVMFTNVFDPGNRLTNQTIALPPSVPGITRQSFGYDALNRLTHAANNYAHVGREYDALSRQTNEVQSIRLDGSGFVNGWEQPVHVSCVFDKQANNIGCLVSAGGNIDLSVTRTMDALNRVDTMSAAYFNTNRPIVDYNYYGPGRIQSKTLGNGARMVLSHDAKRRTQIMLWLDPANLLVGLEYGYDKVDNVLSERFLHDGGRYDHFGYNDRYELTHVDYRSTISFPPAVWRDTFAYDGNYNRTNAAFGGPFDTTITVLDTYGANRVNEYTNIIRNGQTFVVQHDRAGNMTQFPVRPATTNLSTDVQATARWDAFNLMFDIENPATGRQRYFYDPFRRRIACVDSESDLQGSRRVICHGWSDIEERVFIPGATLANAPSRLERIYVDGPRIDEHLLAAIDRDGDGMLGGANLKNVRDVTADQEYFFLHNRLGSTMALSDADNAGRILEYVRYTAYGEAIMLAALDNNSDGREDTSLDLGDNATTDPRRFSEEYANPFLFTGRRFDNRSGLHYYRFRYYESRSGSFISRDPAGYIDSLNAYAYVLSSPVVYNDPKGLDVTCVGIGGTFAFIVGAGLNLSFCWDECKNWAIVVSASARVGAEVGVGINVLVSDGGLADYISGWSFDFNLGEGIVSGGADRSDSGKQGGHVGIGPGFGASAGAGLSAMIYGDLSKGYPCPPESNSKDIALIREVGERTSARAARWARYPDCPKCCEERHRANLRSSDEERERYGQPDFIPLSPGK